MQQPRVLLLIRHVDEGGAERCVLNLAGALRKINCKPLVYGWRGGGVLVPQFRAADIALEIPAIDLGGWRRIKVPRTLLEVVERHDIDVIHAHMSDCATWGVMVQRRSGQPCVVTHHTNDLIDTVGQGRPFYGWMRKRLLFAAARRAAANITVSASVQERLSLEAAIPQDRIDVIPNGVLLPPEEIVAKARAQRTDRASAHPDARLGPNLLFAGRLHPVKNLETLIAAAPRILKAYPNATFELLGDGGEKATLQALAHDYAVADHVRFAGYVSDVGPRLADADLMVSPSLVEGMPLAILEAMALCLPVVASDIPGHRELVRPGKTGSLFAVKAPDLLAQAVIAALQNWPTTEAHAQGGRALIQERYSVTAMAQNHLELYHRVIQTASNSRAAQ